MLNTGIHNLLDEHNMCMCVLNDDLYYIKAML